MRKKMMNDRLPAFLVLAGLWALPVAGVNAMVLPPDPMMAGGRLGELGMFHGMISINASNEVVVDLGPGMSPAGNTPVLPLKFIPDTHPDYTDETGTGGADWTVLNGKSVNAQLGWLAGNAGGWTVPDGSAVWIETISVAGPGTLEVYEGGQGSASVLLPKAGHTLDPILAVGQPWKWFDPVAVTGNTTPPFTANGSGLMVHNWYATDTPGLYEVQYLVYVGDAATGVLDPTYTPATVNLAWVPEPATLAVLSLGMLGMLRRDVSAS